MTKLIKLIIITILSSLFVSNLSFGQTNFDNFFTDGALRIDYYHCGNANSEKIFFKEFIKEEFWAGNRSNLIDKMNYGKYQIKIKDLKTDSLIFSYGFCTLFSEYQHTEMAKDIDKCFPESIIIPFPKNSIRCELYSRNFDTNNFIKIWEIKFDPTKEYCNKEKIINAKVIDIHCPANYSKAVDFVFISEGYTEKEINNFLEDVNNISTYILSIEPYNEYKDRINIRAIAIPSPESGTDIPHKNIWKNTPLNSKFNTFNSERYLTVIDYHILYDYAALAPCDQICILVNTPEYGGGGIYNFWNLTSAKHPYFKEIFAHELGHSFAALADEYCDSDASTENMYNLNNEPYEANITTLIDFDSKWKNIIEKNVPVPTPEEEKYFDKIGVYEGAAYKTKGIYRPYINCKMKSLNADFCPICKKTIAKTIKIYID